MILAFATRTASILACCFLGKGVFIPSRSVGTVASSWIGAVELCSIGCTLMGPVDGDLRLGIRDNSLLPSWFNGSEGGHAGVNLKLTGPLLTQARLVYGQPPFSKTVNSNRHERFRCHSTCKREGGTAIPPRGSGPGP
jgi:hypothetical protein